ncbi:MAG: MMPL family transporter, partial [Rhodospirillaceae bacterium]|nr:MMPL family transporter [Rhodospirillaceae bacterium]
MGLPPAQPGSRLQVRGIAVRPQGFCRNEARRAACPRGAYETNGAGSVDEHGIAREPFAKRFAERVLAARWPVILGTLLFVAAASGGIALLEFSANYRIFFDEDNPQLRALETLEDTYGKNDNVAFLIVPDDGDATSQKALSAAVWLTEAAWNTPHSRRVDSLANFQYTTADGDDLYVQDLVDPQELGRADVRSRIRSVALSDPRIAGSILARNGDVSVVSVTIELPEEGLLEASAEVAEFVRSVAAEAEKRFPGIDLRVVGTVMVNQTFVEASIGSQTVFLPASLLLMALILGVLIRGWAGVAATGLVIVFSILASMGLGAWVGLPFSPPISPAPTIVLMIVVANCVHLLVALQQRLRAGDSRHDAI